MALLSKRCSLELEYHDIIGNADEVLNDYSIVESAEIDVVHQVLLALFEFVFRLVYQLLLVAELLDRFLEDFGVLFDAYWEVIALSKVDLG